MTSVNHFAEVAMEVYIETVSVGGIVTARIVLQGKSFTKEIARLSLTQAHWEDFTNCLHRPARIERGRIVFSPERKGDTDPSKEIASTITAYRKEAVA
jgi:hypothetical protein